MYHCVSSGSHNSFHSLGDINLRYAKRHALDGTVGIALLRVAYNGTVRPSSASAPPLTSPPPLPPPRPPCRPADYYMLMTSLLSVSVMGFTIFFDTPYHRTARDQAGGGAGDSVSVSRADSLSGGPAGLAESSDSGHRPTAGQKPTLA